ncbi:MAG: sodium:calcium antiporter [Actinomycetota bacterium]|nr:sodium:calcium antiporter [Actinomycetota bacterium]
MEAVDIVRVIAGLVVLIVAADRLVLSAVRIAKVFNVSVVIIGAVIVGFGTSIPEFVVSALAASDGQTGLAMSNVVASNTANLTLVLGASALFVALATKQTVIKREGLLMLGSVGVFAVVLLDGQVSRIEGISLVLGMVAAIWLLVLWSKEEDGTSADDLGDIVADPDKISREIFYGLLALVATVLAGAQLLKGVVSIGDDLGLSVVFMGLVTGVGTSLPELSAALAAVRRRATDLVLGNVLGSNIFNSLGVAGLAAIIGPGEISGVPPILVSLMVLSAVLAGVFAYTSQRINRVEGVILIALFSGYVALSI